MQARTYKLADVASVFNGKTPSRKEQRTKGFPVLKIKDINEDGQFVGCFDSFVDEGFAEQFSDKVICVGDTLVLNAAHSASYVGSKVYFTEPAVVGSLPTGEWLLIRPNAHKAVPEYVHYWVQSKPTRRRIRDLVKGIHLYPKDVARLRISLPSLPEQKRIAAILAKADRLRRLRRFARDLSDTYLQSVFLEMFGNPVTNPKSFPLARFGEVCETRLGKMLDAKQQTGKHRRPYLRNVNVQWGRIDLSDLQEMDFDEREREILRLRKGDVLICEGGEVGRAAIWNGELPEMYYQKALHQARPNPKLAVPEFIVWLMWCLANLGGLVDFTSQVTIAHLTGVKLKTIEFPLPPLPLQQQFARIVHQFERLRAQQREAQRQAEHLFQALLHRAFREELA